MELEMETIERDLKAVEKSYGENMLMDSGGMCDKG